MFPRLYAVTIAAGMILSGAALPGHAQGNVESKVLACAACHGQNGVPSDPKTVPVIWGQQQYYVFKQLNDYKNDLRSHPIMSPLAKGLQRDDLRPIAAYFAGKAWPAKSVADAPAAPNGISSCAACHQANFQGGVSWPRLAGLSYEYLVASMRSFANEERVNNEDMVKIMKMFTDSERDAMARYLAGL
jgi:cytochrome c553